MGRRKSSIAVDTVKIVVGSAGILWMEPWLSSTLKLNAILAYLIAAVVSGFAVSTFSALVLAQPTVTLHWANAANDVPSPSGTIDLDFKNPDLPQVITLQVDVASRSWIGERLLRVLRGSFGTKVRVAFEPAGALWFTPDVEATHARAHVDREAISYSLDSNGSGPWSWARFSVECGGSPTAMPVRVSLLLENDLPWKRLVLRYVRREAGVSAIRAIRT